MNKIGQQNDQTNSDEKPNQNSNIFLKQLTKFLCNQNAQTNSDQKPNHGIVWINKYSEEFGNEFGDIKTKHVFEFSIGAEDSHVITIINCTKDVFYSVFFGSEKKATITNDEIPYSFEETGVQYKCEQTGRDAFTIYVNGLKYGKEC